MKKNQITVLAKSPLRYPGSKQKFCVTFADWFKKNNIPPDLFIEPFAGGASISIFLLQKGLVKKIALIEKDPLIASLWKTIFNESEWLIKEIKKLKLTIDNWNYFKQYKPKSTRTKALKCLFLNRTNFSGILNAGPIGGKKQQSKYPLDCRFNKEEIIRRITILAQYQNCIEFIEEGDYLEILSTKLKNMPENTFFYFDPPYVNKAEQLYNFYFNDQNHIELRNYLKYTKFNWLLSYDYSPSIEILYKSHKFCNTGYLDIIYSTSIQKQTRNIKKEFLASNLTLNL